MNSVNPTIDADDVAHEGVMLPVMNAVPIDDAVAGLLPVMDSVSLVFSNCSKAVDGELDVARTLPARDAVADILIVIISAVVMVMVSIQLLLACYLCCLGGLLMLVPL